MDLPESQDSAQVLLAGNRSAAWELEEPWPEGNASWPNASTTSPLEMGNYSVPQPCVPISVLIHRMNDWTQLGSVRFFTFAAYALLFFVGMIGNCGIILSICRRKDELKVVANVFLLNLSVIDVLLCLVAVPVTPITSVYKQWYFGDLLCKLVPVTQGMAVLITSLSLVFIAVDRYRNIVQGTERPWEWWEGLGLVAASWLFAALVNGPVFSSQRLAPLEGASPAICGEFCTPHNWASETGKKVYGSVMLSLQFILPSMLLAYSYARILLKVRKDMLVSAVAGATQQSVAAARKTRVMRVLILMVAAFLVSWLPLSVLNILRDFDADLGPTIQGQIFFFSNLFHFAAMTSVVWNPLLYFWLSKYRRRDVRRTVSSFGHSVRRHDSQNFSHYHSHAQSSPGVPRPHRPLKDAMSTNGLRENLPLLPIPSSPSPSDGSRSSPLRRSLTASNHLFQVKSYI